MEESVSQKEKEKAEEEMIEQAFQELLNDYLPIRRIKESTAVRASLISCTPSPLPRLCAMR